MQIPVSTQTHIQQNKLNLPNQKVNVQNLCIFKLCTSLYERDRANKKRSNGIYSEIKFQHLPQDQYRFGLIFNAYTDDSNNDPEIIKDCM